MSEFYHGQFVYGTNFNDRGSIMEYEEQQTLNNELRQQAQTGSFEEILKRLDQGGEINAPDETGQTTLHYAVQRDDSRLVHALIEKGADVNFQDEKLATDTALMLAAEIGSLKVVKMLLRAGADPYITGSVGNDALDRAEQSDAADASKIKDAITRTCPPKKKRRMR